MKKILYSFVSLILCLVSLAGKTYKVSTPAEFQKTISSVVPGDTVILSNGDWKDAVLEIKGFGEKDNPIIVCAEEKGSVTLSGKSCLKISGQYIIVSGMVFTNGYSPDESVIVFRTDEAHLANNCRVTECVIDGFNTPDRFDKSDWVKLYGKNNRVDHCYFGGKLNSGVTLVVRLNSKESRENYHRIDHNYFGKRERLGSNGGETIRIGVGTYSLMSSNTIIENNYFDQCNGETEHISIKSCDNIVKNNVFYECEGALVLRHGNRNLIEGNYFIGNNKAETGGVRVINKGQIIRNNYFQELAGDRFRSALSVMNGVPNSRLNRYHQVEDVIIENNTFINCSNIKYGVGSDNERTAVPIKTTIKDNLFYNPQSDNVYEALDDISGITFSGNKVVTKSRNCKLDGFDEVKVELNKENNGLWKGKNCNPEWPVLKSETGVSWYEPNHFSHDFIASGNIFKVDGGKNKLVETVASAKPGDTIILCEEGDYLLTETIKINVPLKIMADKHLTVRPVLKINKKEGSIPFIQIENGGSLIIEGIAFNGASESGISSNGICTSKKPMIQHYNLQVINCEFYEFNESSYCAFFAYQSTFADSVTFKGCVFRNMSGSAIDLSSEKEDKGKYNAEFITIENCFFYDIMGEAINVYRGGNDESTFGPFLTVDQCSFVNVNNKELGSVMRLIGVQYASVKNCLFSNSGKSGRVIKFEDPRWANITLDYLNVFHSGRIECFYNDRIGNYIFNFDPEFDNNNSCFILAENSPLLKKGENGKTIGSSVK